MLHSDTIALSDTLIDAYHEKIQPWCLQDPATTITILKSIKAFIDDVAMSVGSPQLQFQDLTLRAEQQLQWWNNLLQASGGALNSQKCCCAIYQWEPDKYGILCQSKTIAPCNIQLHPNQNSTIQVLAPSEGTRYLGIYIAPNGSTTTMETQLWKKAVLYTKALQRTHMSRREAGVLYHSCFLPAIVYPFPATWLPARFLERIMRLSTTTILNKMGFHRNLPRSLVFAPRTVGGVGLCNLNDEHAAQQTLILIRHLRAKTPLGTTMEVLLRLYQLWAGQREPVLVNTAACPWIPDHWISHLRASMNRHSIMVTHNAWTIPALRPHDRFLMDDFNNFGFPQFKLE